MIEPLPSTEPLPLPGAGEVSRVRRGRHEFVLERARGAWLLAVHDGAHGQRYHLGLPPGSSLQLVPATPHHPIDVQLEDGVALAPGGRVRGSVVLPLLTRLVWVAPGRPGGAPGVATGGAMAPGGEEELLCVLPREYGTTWVDGQCRHQCSAALLAKGATPWAPGLLQVPVVLKNEAPSGVQPGQFPLQLAAEDLNLCRGRLVARPRRIVHSPEGKLSEHIRPWPPAISATIHTFPS